MCSCSGSAACRAAPTSHYDFFGEKNGEVVGYLSDECLIAKLYSDHSEGAVSFFSSTR